MAKSKKGSRTAKSVARAKRSSRKKASRRQEDTHRGRSPSAVQERPEIAGAPEDILPDQESPQEAGPQSVQEGRAEAAE